MMSIPNIGITGIEYRHWKCFDEAKLEQLSKVNILIGQNNVGKSALLLALRRLTRIAPECVPLLGSPDGAAHFGASHSFRTFAGDVMDGAEDGRLRVNVSVADPRFAFTEDFPYLLERANPGNISLTLELGTGQHPPMSLTADSYRDLLDAFEPFFEPNNRPDAAGTSAHSASFRCSHAIASALANRIVYVPHEREIHSSLQRVPYSVSEERKFSGGDAIQRLAQWRMTDDDYSLLAIESFISQTVGVPVRIRPNLEPAIEIKLGAHPWRNLKQFGAGMGQLLVMAIATQLTSESILLLEEPEISLHPRLQRSLMRVIPKFCTQAFITTHSNNLIDNADANTSLYHVRTGHRGISAVKAVEARAIEALRDIGVRPSSLTQANAVLWVEGPSDAIYLRRWLSETKKDLVEGFDFVFAFYGGALLAHTGEFRDLAFQSIISEINPNYFVVLDSDPDKEGRPGHAYAKPWIAHGQSWMTEPKEVEGYVSDEALLAALGGLSTTASDTLIPLKVRLQQLGLPHSWSDRKVELARAVVSLPKTNIIHPRHSSHLQANLRRIADFLCICRDSEEAAQVGELSGTSVASQE